jgi:arylformamidase
MKKFYDITRTLGKDEICYPGDHPFETVQAFSIEKSDPFNLMQLKFSNHIGTHIDAPKHFVNNGKTLDRFPIDRFIMEAIVVEINSDAEIAVEEILQYEFPKGGAVLFKTKNQYLSRKEFDQNYVYLNSKAAKKIVENQIFLVGIGYISIESYHDETYPVHKLLLQSEILILEDIDLKSVPAGKYQLICLPLKIFNSDAAPCRAVLVK